MIFTLHLVIPPRISARYELPLRPPNCRVPLGTPYFIYPAEQHAKGGAALEGEGFSSVPDNGRDPQRLAA